MDFSPQLYLLLIPASSSPGWKDPPVTSGLIQAQLVEASRVETGWVEEEHSELILPGGAGLSADASYVLKTGDKCACHLRAWLCFKSLGLLVT